MKIEIDLNNILGDEYGAETLQDSVRRQVIEKVSHEIKQGIAKKIDEAISAAITEEIKANLKTKVPQLMDDLLNAEYTPVNRWGDAEHGKTTTFRKEFVKSVFENMKYEQRTYHNDRNAFTNAINAVIESEMDKFKKEFNSIITKELAAKTIEFATTELKKKLQL